LGTATYLPLKCSPKLFLCGWKFQIVIKWKRFSPWLTATTNTVSVIKTLARLWSIVGTVIWRRGGCSCKGKMYLIVSKKTKKKIKLLPHKSYAFGTMYSTTRVCGYHGYFWIEINRLIKLKCLLLVVPTVVKRRYYEDIRRRRLRCKRMI